MGKSLAVTINENNNGNSDRIIFSSKTQNCMSLSLLYQQDNQTLSKLFSKKFEILVYWDKYKTKSENNNTTNE